MWTHAVVIRGFSRAFGVGGDYVKMVERWCWSMQEIKLYSRPIVATYVVCDWRWYSYEMSWWSISCLLGRCEISLWDVMPFIPCPNSRSLGFGSEEVMQRHACEKWVREKGGMGGWLGNKMLRGGESSWSCMKLSLPSFAGHNMLISVLLPFFLVRCLWTNSASFSYEISSRDVHALCGPLWDFLMRCHAF